MINQWRLMIDINSCYAEASRNIFTWRNRYTTKEYPHKVVINMMYRAYTMNYIWERFENGLLPKFERTDDALTWAEKYYSKVSIEKINSILLNCLESDPDRTVGTLTYSNYASLASLAENDDEMREEIEFSYLFNLLEDKCVLYFIALRQMGWDFVDTVNVMTNYLIEDIPDLTYGSVKQIFQFLLVGKYMNEHYTRLP